MVPIFTPPIPRVHHGSSARLVSLGDVLLPQMVQPIVLSLDTAGQVRSAGAERSVVMEDTTTQTLHVYGISTYKYIDPYLTPFQPPQCRLNMPVS